MAARLHPSFCRPEIVDLRRVSARDLESLLTEETDAWRVELDWDFEKSADLVRRFVDLRALHGSALIENGDVAGYLYYVLEDGKGLIGDLYVRRSYRTAERENTLLGAAVDNIMSHHHARRIESQLMMLQFAPHRQPPAADYMGAFERNFMRVDLHVADLGDGEVRRPMYIDKWSEHYQESAAALIAEAYEGHVDSRINDQYRSQAGARRFLSNIVQYPGCGAFFRPASYVAFDGVSHRLCGISLASLVAPESGHITQICVSRAVRRTGIGHALLRQSLLTLRDLGCRSASLTVTASNASAVKLYEDMGFETVRRFLAYVWDGF
jgi:ribosomal protein S18 acetylase RimI-like enzyme